MTDTHDHHPRDAPIRERENEGADADPGADGGDQAGSRGQRRAPAFDVPHAFPHPAPPQNGHIRIAWGPSWGRAPSIRIRDLTCECLPTSYELCAGGGLLHIRRTQRRPQGTRISESPWVRTAEGLALWIALLEGRAR
ncbi:hypothetical protein HD597_001268 [Nonomuraea thailandensis]|uniref:Uncharacterized protein n=1 Tax=Nonomuraea thailandensis TaxID=1188745 RepID=A0A9X2JYV7_9ACTN|nr:hypothetical protein [Nonomuraea thailandensis]MCP2354248.1 hypothetical protein [Nonomuraea thailandensis]